MKKGFILAGFLLVAPSAFAAAETACPEQTAGFSTGSTRSVVDGVKAISFEYLKSWKCVAAASSIRVEEVLTESTNRIFSYMPNSAAMKTEKALPITSYLGVESDKFVLEIKRMHSDTGGLEGYLRDRFPRDTWEKARVSGRDGYQYFGFGTSRIYLQGEGDIVYVISNSVDRDGIPSAAMQVILGTFTVLSQKE